MKKNYLRSILLCIPICLILYGGNVKAESITCPVGEEEGSEIAITNMEKSFALAEGNRYFTSGFYYKFSINNSAAFCVDLGKKMKSNLLYKKIGTINSSFSSTQIVNLKKAWAFYENHKGDDKYHFMAQIFMWLAVQNISTGAYEGTLYDALMNYYKVNYNEGYGRMVATGEAKNLLAEFKNTSPTTKNLYLWKNTDNPGSYQRLITALPNGEPCVPGEPPGETPNPEPSVPKCDIDIDIANKINSCADGGGTIYETTSGTCLEKYVGWNNNKFGEPINSNVGNYCQAYCLKSISETYPGNISKAVNAGRYIVWPNNNISSNTYKINANLATYPLQITLNQRCRIMVNQENLLNDYRTTSQNEYNYYFTRDSYNNYVGQVFQNYNNSCSWYQQNQNDKQIKYDSAKKSYNNCLEENKTWSEQKTCLEWTATTTTKKKCKKWKAGWVYNKSACSSQKNVLDDAESELNKAKDSSTKCNTYKDLFDKANSVLSTFNTCITANFTNGLDFSADYSVSFEGEGNYSGEYQLYESGNGKKCDNCSGYSGISLMSNQYRYSSSDVQADLINRIAQVENREVNMEITKTYDLKEDPANGNYYYYVNKDTNESVNLANRGTNYSTIGFSNMPVSYSSKIGKKYNIALNLNNVTSDSIKSEFKQVLLSQEYVCNYEVTKTTTSECICPSGTKHEGESLDCLISNINESGQYKYTCSEAQYVYCDSETNISDYVCPNDPDGPDGPGGSNDKLTCPNDPSMDLTACVNEGYSYSYCVGKFCYNNNNNNNNHYVCPSGTNEGMNLDACVIPMILKGYSEKDAYEYCKDTTCPYGGIKIIYRTISLQNPFPSYNADKTVDETGLSVGMFNDTVKGRYPGKNWNSTAIVKSKILNNRNVDGDAVYSKEPLYTFTLNTDTIKNIRKYNKSQKDSYSNFDLNCLINNSIGCVSDFVHNHVYGLTSGTCDKKLTASNFYTCDD